MNNEMVPGSFDPERTVAEISAHVDAIRDMCQRVSDVVQRRIALEVADPQEANAIIDDQSHALSRLRCGTEEQRFAALLALTFLRKETGAEFRKLVIDIVSVGAPSEIRGLAVTTLANLYAGTGNPEILSVLDTLGQQLPHARFEKEAIDSAIARINSPEEATQMSIRVARASQGLTHSFGEMQRRVAALRQQLRDQE